MRYQCPFCSFELIRNDSFFCSTCQVSFPVSNGFTFFNEAEVRFSPTGNSRSTLKFDKTHYTDFLKRKGGKSAPDLYAAFQPFNESSRAFEPFIPFLRQNLKTDDVILDLWCRTGWSALYLSGLFPDQKIISVWEGNRGVLGYKGFSFWFDDIKIPDNLEIIFLDINHRFSIPDQSVKLVYGLDTLHRYSKPNIINECLRVTSEDGFLFFPHVHMANSDPDPFFERGGDILHGEKWEFYLANKLKNSGRKHFIFSEPGLFEKPDSIEFISNPSTADYNGFIGIFPENNIPQSLHRWEYETSDVESQFIYLNPLLDINYPTGMVKVDLTKWDSGVDYILKRHPVYHKRLNMIDSVSLDELSLKICYLSRHRYSVSEMAEKLNCEIEQLKEKIIEGIEKELFRVYPLKNKQNLLQFYHADQQLRPILKLCTFPELWKNAMEAYSDRILIRSVKDESEFSYSHVDHIVRKIAAGLASSCVNKGDAVIVFSNISEEFLLCSWAVWLSGCVLVPVNPELSDDDKKQIIAAVNPAFIFNDPDMSGFSFLSEVRTPVVLFSSESGSASSAVSLINWLQAEHDNTQINPAHVSSADTACILFTSGTTSQSKAVVLSHEALFNSSFELTNLFQWNSDDVILNLGDSYTMSGLRNPTWGVIQSGASVLVIPISDKKYPQKISEHIFRWNATVLGCVPEMVRLLLESSGSISPKMLKPLKQVICTASYLAENIRIKFEEYYLKPVLNYYGLTETCGLCAGHKYSDNLDTNDSIGKSVDAIMQVVDGNGKILPVNTVGQLRVFSANLMKGYFNDPDATRTIINNGWLYTGDLAVIDEAGFIYLRGRDRDIIKLKDGNLIFPDSIENILLDSALISEAAVTSFSKKDESEKVIAFVKLKSGTLTNDLIYEFKRTILSKLGSHFVPEIFVNCVDLPKGINGKILKTKLRTQYEANANNSI